MHSKNEKEFATNSEVVDSNTDTVSMSQIGLNSNEANEMGWSVSKVYLELIEEYNKENPSSNLDNIMSYSKTDESYGYLLLGIKYDKEKTIFAYEAVTTDTNDTVVLYVELYLDSTTKSYAGPVSDEDEILLRIKSEEASTTNANEILNSEESTSENVITEK